MVMYNVIVLNSAHKDIDDIYNFCNNISINYALKVRSKIREAIQSLKHFPFINPLYALFENEIFRKHIVNKRYLIIFSIIGQTIVVFHIIDGRKNIKPTDLFKPD